MSSRSAYEFRKERDEDLLNAYRSLIRQTDHITASEIMLALSRHPASRFWVSEERAVGVVARLLRGNIPKMSGNKLSMFREITSRTRKLMSQKGMSLRFAVRKVIEGPAPSFYITPLSAKMLISRAKRRKKLERRAK